MELFNTEQLKLAYEYVQYTGKNIFLTGKAGTGKTTFLHNLKKTTSKRMIVVAPTGVASINAGGVTIHSFFQLPFTPYIPNNYIDSNTLPAKPTLERNWKMSSSKIDIIRSLDILVIDEISMVRADLLDQIDEVLRRYKNRNKVFGGVQLLMIGDLKQLAPIAGDDEWKILRKYYESIFFFSSKALNQAGFIGIELTHIFRQKDDKFISILNKIRDNKMTPQDFKMLDERHIANFRPQKEGGYITLTTHNFQSNEINLAELDEIPQKEHRFIAEVEGNFPEYSYPTDKNLILKIGAQVMFVKNDLSPEKRYYNGKIGEITEISENYIYVKCKKDEHEIEVEKVTWENIRYSINDKTKEINEDVAGVFKQYPLKLAWAITIHKSQGLTFEKAIIDANAAFAHGQVYVALSRCKTLEGLILSSPLSPNSIITNSQVTRFSQSVEHNPPKPEQLSVAKKEYELNLIFDLFKFNDILHRLYAGRKTLNMTNAAGIEKSIEAISLIINKIKADIVEVGEKFEKQCQNLFMQNSDINSNNILQERISKASHYFYDKLKDITTNDIDKINIDTDSSAAKKSISQLINDLSKLCETKLICLSQSKNGFNTLDYLTCRATASIKAKKIKKKVEKDNFVIIDDDIKYPELYQILKNWRNSVAEENDLPYYGVIQVQAMREISTLLPLTSKDLLRIKGIGKRKLEKYGETILEIVRKYADKNKLQSAFENQDQMKIYTVDKVGKAPEKKKASITDTVTQSLNLFKQGKNIEEIAAERALSYGTIAVHLTQCITDGKIAVNELIDKEKSQKIMDYFNQADDYTLLTAKNYFGDDYSWEDLRFVAAHIRREKDE